MLQVGWFFQIVRVDLNVAGESAGMLHALMMKVIPVYSADARAAPIQGTVVLRPGDITDLELVDGPIALAGSRVAAVRQRKYYRLLGQPVTVDTQIQVNHQLLP